MTGKEPQTLTIEGPKNARLDSTREGLRFYEWIGRELPSATSVRRAAGLPHRLHQWTISRVVARAVLDYPTLGQMLTRERKPRERVLEKNRILEASKWLRAAATEERNRSAALGTAVHKAAAEGMTPETLPDTIRVESDGEMVEVAAADIAPRLGWYLDWLRVSQVEIVASEFQVWNLTEGYAGSGDILGRFRNGSLHIVDIKTGGECDCAVGTACVGGHGIYTDQAIQQIAYKRSEHIGSDGVIDERLTTLLHQVSGIALLHLSDDGWEYRQLVEEPGLWGAFRGLLAYAQWSLAHRDAASITAAVRRSGDMVAGRVICWKCHTPLTQPPTWRSPITGGGEESVTSMPMCANCGVAA